MPNMVRMNIQKMSQQEFAALLDWIRGTAVCSYREGKGPARFCDCKYGAETGKQLYGEQSGCCELRVAVELIRAMTDTEYQRVFKRISKARGFNVYDRSPKP